MLAIIGLIMTVAFCVIVALLVALIVFSLFLRCLGILVKLYAIAFGKYYTWITDKTRPWIYRAMGKEYSEV